MRRQTFRITNYEMEILRRQPTRRAGPWSYVWASVSDPFHPTSLEDWQRYCREQGIVPDLEDDH
jgi:hypothetical protein